MILVRCLRGRKKNYLCASIMKQISLLFIVLVATSINTLFGQSSNLIFFAENGERFTIVMNGLRYNESPATNVKVTDLTPAVYKVKAIFEDPALGEVSKTIPLEPAREYTFNLRLKKQTAVGKTVGRMGKQVARDLNLKDSSEVYEDPADKYVMRFVSEVPLNAYATQSVQTQHTQPVVTGGATVTTTETTTTTVRTSGTVPDAGVNMSVNDPALGVNINMNLGGTGAAVQHTQVTTTTTSHSGAAQPSHYVMPGYNGPIGCPWPMDKGAFGTAVSTISGQTFEDNKLQVAKQVFTSNCMTSAQVAEILRLFTFEESRLEFAKFAYGRTYDLGNYFVVNSAFTFSSSVDELNDFISGSRR